MGLFGKSFEAKVQEAVDRVNRMNLGVKGLRASVEGKVVTLEGEAGSMEVKGRVVQEFNKLVETENTLNKIRVVAQAAAPSAKPMMPGPAVPGPGTPVPGASAAAPGEQIHTVQPGDTLSALALKYYGKASLYPKIFEANRDILKNPDLIKVGQRLRIPK